VEEFDAAIAQLRTHNVKFKIEPTETPVGDMAFLYDSEGNLICIHKRKAK
jgi:predicted enzyme related to lactoylglutathione lyase